METTKTYKDTIISQDIIDLVKAELNELDKELVEIEGTPVKPSHCYRVGVNPLHVLFNTNCPGTLKEKVEAILFKYLPHESSAPE